MNRIDQLMKAAHRIELIADRDVSILPGKRDVELRFLVGDREVISPVTVTSCDEWFKLRDVLKLLADARRIPFSVLFK